MEKKEPSYTTGGHINWYNHYEEPYRSSFKKLNIELQDPATPILGIYLEKNIAQKDTCSPTFTAALSTIAKPTKCPLTAEWIKKMLYMYTIYIYTHNRILLSHKS